MIDDEFVEFIIAIVFLVFEVTLFCVEVGIMIWNIGFRGGKGRTVKMMVYV